MLVENQYYPEIGDKELKIAQQLEEMGYIHYKIELEEKLKSKNARIAISNRLKLYG